MLKGDGFLFPFHNFTIFKHNDKSSRNIKDINDCKISVGRIVENRGDKLLVAQRPIIWEFGKFLLGGFSEIETEKGFVDEVKKGNWMSSHYGIGRQILSEKEADCLIKKTEEAIDLFNKNSI
jgi:hypothetical protein